MSIMALQFPLAAVLLLLSAARTTKTTAAAQALPGCSDKCGDLTIPYPFGMNKDCYLREEFFINCSNTAQPPTAYLMTSNLTVTNISLDDGELRILNMGAEDCYNAQGNVTSNFPYELSLPLPYTISYTKNKFYTVGCDSLSIFQGFRGEDELEMGCMSMCNRLDIVDQYSCSGAGCCQTNIPRGLKNVTVLLDSLDNHAGIWEFNPCGYAFIAEQGQFNFSAASLKKQNNYQLPSVLNWAIGNETDSCDEAHKKTNFACKANSMCVNGSVGYLCRCLPGYEGNPYHPDRWLPRASNLCQNGQCLNTFPPGNYSCSCHKGYKNDGMNDKSCIEDDSKRHSKIVLLLIVSLGMYN
ncbi:putative green fluorescent protein [Rosa chinensis]|uniref:Putative green fluorescent protein n=1 Tax=Rosa chinensis TaxID=74649 RepID=A0A2P6SAD1_ROSCH|nr:putative green fluorescent protein [Rosa chinensis]